MSALRVYRIVVESWPTLDGEPWARFYGEGAAVPNDEIPEWLEPYIAKGFAAYGHWSYLWNRKATDEGRIAERLRVHEGWGGEEYPAAVLMPKPKRKHYLSASGASELAADMRAFGAVVRVEKSAPVSWDAS